MRGSVIHTTELVCFGCIQHISQPLNSLDNDFFFFFLENKSIGSSVHKKKGENIAMLFSESKDFSENKIVVL